MKRLCFLLILVLTFACSKPTKFKLLSSNDTGIDFNNYIEESDSLLVVSNGAGVGIGDLNNDNLQDVIFAGNKVSSRIYLNQGNFKFKDITSNFKGLSDKQWFSSVTVIDINNDGWLDVYFTSTVGQNAELRKNRLWMNMGVSNGEGPFFTEEAEKYGIAISDPSVDAAFLDYDLDGDLDLYILNSNLIMRSNSTYRPRINDGSAQNNDKLFKNNGNGTFSDVSLEAGIRYEGYGMGVAVGDMNKDGYPDIYISNDYLTNDLLYINQGDGTFRNEIKKYLSYQTHSSMGNDLADVNNDGLADIFTLDMLPATYHKKRQTLNGFSYGLYRMDERFGYEHQYIRNMLHLHNGFINGNLLPYSEVGQIAGLFDTEWSWSPLFADFDNDGDKDLIVSNGYPKDMTDKDWAVMNAKLQGAGSNQIEIISLLPPVFVPNMAFENAGELKFIKKKDWLPNIPSFSYGASFVDLDNDGDLDYVTNNFNENAFIYRNNTIENSNRKANFLKLKLIGNSGNAMALGAKVEIWHKKNYQYYEHYLSRGYASSVEPVIHFGLGSTNLIDSLKVTWPASGNISFLKNIKAGQTLELNVADSKPGSKKPLSAKSLLFCRVDSILNYEHQQTDFIDFFLDQKIIPHKFSQIGPVIAKGDLNKDGEEDLIIGSTNMLPTKVFLKKGELFEEAFFEGLTGLKNISESDLTILDFDNDGDNDVIAVAGGLETKKESQMQDYRFMTAFGDSESEKGKEFQHVLYENQNGTFIKHTLPVPAFLASCIRPFDFNHDGFVDFFIGSRVKKGKFPYADNSWIILNKNGKLQTDSTLSFNLGMVTDAVWADYDKDGWEDLLVAREYNSLVMLKNMHGEKMLVQDIPEFKNKHGIWYSLAAGDFDLDGDVDFIAGNLGDNHQYNISEKYPIKLYALDIDMNGTLDPIRTAFWKDKKGKMKEYLINYLDELREQSSYFQIKFPNYKSFSTATINNILDHNLKKRIELNLYANTTSSYILWNNEGVFEWQKLPVELQVSPVKKIIVEDFNKDKFPDIMLGGNDYTYDVGTGFFDANKGLVLINKGDEMNNGPFAFEILNPSESGMLLQGMLESLLFLKGNPSYVIAGFNRSKVKVYKLLEETKTRNR